MLQFCMNDIQLPLQKRLGLIILYMSARLLDGPVTLDSCKIIPINLQIQPIKFNFLVFVSAALIMLQSTLSHILYSIDSNAKIGIFRQISLWSFLFLIFIERTLSADAVPTRPVSKILLHTMFKYCAGIVHIR